MKLKETKESFGKVETAYKKAGGKCDVYGFAWNGDSGVIQFNSAEEAARYVGKGAFSKFIRDLKAKCPKTKINIGTHSLAAAVALAKGAGVNGIGNVILTNAAVDNEVLEPGEEFSNAPKNAQSITLAISREDDILEYIYKFPTLDYAIGQTGPEHPNKVPSNVYTKDYTDIFGDAHGAVYNPAVNEKYWNDFKKPTD